jgi:hypothetical protein
MNYLRFLGNGAGWSKDGPQGLKPIHFIGLIGTAEAVPFQNRGKIEFFRSL